MGILIQGLQVLLFLAIATIVIVCYLAYEYHMDKRRKVKNAHDLERAMVAFEQSKVDTAHTARMHGMVIEYGVNNTLKAVFDYPQAASNYKIEMEKPVDPKQIEAPQLIIPQAPPFRSISHLMTPQRIITAFTAGGPVYGEISDLLSMALIGKPKRGKTTALLYYLCILLQSGAEVWIWDPHGEMSELSYGLHYYDSLEEIAASVPLLWKSLNEREELYKATKQVKHPLVLLVDEVPVIADWEKEQVKQKRKIYSPYRVMKRFTLEARKWNGYVFISGQSLPSTVLPTLTRDNLSSRLVLECSADHARMVGLPKDAIDTLLPHLKGADRGTHIADFSSWSHPELADIPYTTIDDLRHIIDGRGTWETPVSTWETPLEADANSIENVFSVSRGETPPSVKAAAMVGNDIRETVRRMHRKGMALRDIASLVGLSGRKYSLFQEVCREEGIIEQVDSDA